MDQIQNTSTGAGELKNYYDPNQSVLSKALERKRKKLTDDRFGEYKSEDPAKNNEES